MSAIFDTIGKNNHFILNIQSHPQDHRPSDTFREDFLYYSTRLVPLISMIKYPAGMKASLALRTVNDLLSIPRLPPQGLDKKVALAAFKACLSATSAFCAFIKPDLLQQFEISRSIFVRLTKLYSEMPTLDFDRALKECAYLAADFTNLAVCSYGSLQLKLASHIFQLIATGFEFVQQKDEDSKMGMVLYFAHALFIISSAREIGFQIIHSYKSAPTPSQRESNPNHQPSPTLSPVVPPQTNRLETTLPPHIRAVGTGSEALSQFTFVRSLEDDGLSGELFLVSDKNGHLHTLKRFFNAKEKMDKSAAYALFNVIFFPILYPINLLYDLLNPASIAKEASVQLSGVPNLLKHEQVIQNSGMMMNTPFTDNYLLMEYFDGKTLDKIDQTIKKEPMKQLFHAIADTLRGALSKGFLFQSSNLDHIQVNKDLNQVKFTDPTNFQRMSNHSTMESCILAYRQLYEFFKKLIRALAKNSKETKEKLLKELKHIFSQITLADDYTSMKPKEKEAVKDAYSKIFTVDLLKTIIAQVIELFMKV